MWTLGSLAGDFGSVVGSAARHAGVSGAVVSSVGKTSVKLSRDMVTAEGKLKKWAIKKLAPELRKIGIDIEKHPHSIKQVQKVIYCLAFDGTGDMVKIVMDASLRLGRMVEDASKGIRTAGGCTSR